MIRASDLWEAYFQRVPSGMVVLSAVRDEADRLLDFEILSINEQALRLLGRAEVELLARKVREAEPLLVQAGLLGRLARALESGTVLELEHALPAAPGSREPPVWFSLVAVSVDADKLIVSFDSITRRKRVLLEAVKLMNHDDLTGVGNRRLLKSQYWLKRRQEVDVSLLYFDLNGFKEINDRFGHSTGDELLKVVAQRLAKNIRPNELVARLGGDEFAVLLDTGDRQVAEAVASRLLTAIREPVRVGETSLTVGAAVGIAVYPDDGTGFHDLLRAADKRMYLDKRPPAR